MKETEYKSIITNEDYGYIQFPLYAMRGCLTSTDSLIRIRQAGLYNFASKIKAKRQNIVRQLLYSHVQNNLWCLLKRQIAEYGFDALESPLQYEVDGAYFDPDAVAAMEYLYDNDDDIRRLGTEYYRARTVEKMFRLSFSQEDFESGRFVMEMTPPKEPMPMVNIRVLDDFLGGERTQFEFEQFIGYIAVCSILGQKQYCKTNYKHIRARMFGYSKESDIPEEIKQTDIFKRYCKRYHLDKLMEHLRDHWYVQTYSYYTRGFYISTGGGSIETLVRAGETSKKSNKRKQRQKEISEARAKVLKEMNSSSNNNNTLNKMYNKDD